MAELLGARSREVVFTSGATESIAAACWGAAPRGTHQIFAAVEHSAVREAAARAGDVVVIPVDVDGRIDIDALTARNRPTPRSSCAMGQPRSRHRTTGRRDSGSVRDAVCSSRRRRASRGARADHV